MLMYQQLLSGKMASSAPLTSTGTEHLVGDDSNMVERSSSRAGEHFRTPRSSGNRPRGAASTSTCTSTCSGERGRSRGRRPRGGRLPRGSTGERAERSRSTNRPPRQPQRRGRGRGRPSKRQTAPVAPWDHAGDNAAYFTAAHQTSPSGLLLSPPGKDKMYASAGDRVPKTPTSHAISHPMPIYEDISDPEEDIADLPKHEVINDSVLMCDQRYTHSTPGKSRESTSKNDDNRLFNNNKSNVNEHGQLFKLLVNEELSDPVEVQLKKIFDSPLHSPEPSSSVTRPSKADSTSEPCGRIHESLTESSLVSKEHESDAENIPKEKPLSLRIKITKKNNHCDYSISECDSGHRSEINKSNIDTLDTSDNPLENVVISNVRHIPVDKFRNLSGELEHPSFIAENEVVVQEIVSEAHPDSKIYEEGTFRAIDETAKLDKLMNVEPKNINEPLMVYEVEGEEEDDYFEDDIGCLRIDEDNSSDENEAIPKSIPEQSSADDITKENCKNISKTLSTLRNVTSPISAMSVVQPNLSQRQHVEQITQSSQDKVILSQNAGDKINGVNVSSHRHKDSVSASVQNARSNKLTSAMLVEKSGTLNYCEQTNETDNVVSNESSQTKKSVCTDKTNIGTLPKNGDHYDTAKTLKVGKRKIAHPESQTASWRYPKKMTSSDIESTICAVGSSEESLPTCGQAPRVQGKPDNKCDLGSENESSTVVPQGNTKRRKKNSDHTSAEEIFNQPISSQIGEKGKRLAQEIPGFNWLENKIRNGVVTTKPVSKQTHPDISKPVTSTEAKIFESSDNMKTQVTGSNTMVPFQDDLQKSIQKLSPMDTNSLTTVIIAQQNRVPVIVSTRELENVDSKLRELANVGDLEITIPEPLTSVNQPAGIQGKANNNRISERSIRHHSGRTVREIGAQQSSQAAPTTTSSPSIHTYSTQHTTTHSSPTFISPVNVSIGLQSVNPSQTTHELSKNVMEHGPSTLSVSSINKFQQVGVSAKTANQEGNVSQLSEKNSKQKPTGSLPSTSQSSAINEVLGYHQMQMLPRPSLNHYVPIPSSSHTIQQSFDQPIFPESYGFNNSPYSQRQPLPPPATSVPNQSAQKQQLSSLPLYTQPPPNSQMPLVSHPSASSSENISSHPSSHRFENHFFPASHPHQSIQQIPPHHHSPTFSIPQPYHPEVPCPFRSELPYSGSSTQFPTQAMVIFHKNPQSYCPQYPAPITRNVLDPYHQNIPSQIPPQLPPHHPHSLAPPLPLPPNPSFQVRQPSQQNPQQSKIINWNAPIRRPFVNYTPAQTPQQNPHQSGAFQSTQVIDWNAPLYQRQVRPLGNCTSAQTYLNSNMQQQLAGQSRNNGSKESKQTEMEKLGKTPIPWHRPPQMQQHPNPSTYSHLQVIHSPSSTSHSNESPCSSQSAPLVPYSPNLNVSERLGTMTSNAASSFDSGLRFAFQLSEGYDSANPKQPPRTSRCEFNAVSTNGFKGNDSSNGLSRFGSNQRISDSNNNNRRNTEDSHPAVSSSSSNRSPSSFSINTANQSSTPHGTGYETNVNSAEREAKSSKEADEIAVLEKVKEQTISHLLKIPGSVDRMKKVYTENFIKLLMEGTCSIVGDNLVINVKNDNHVVPLIDVIKIFYPSPHELLRILTRPPTEGSGVHVTTSQEGPLDLSVGTKTQPRNESPASTTTVVPSQSTDSVLAISESQEITPEQNQRRQQADERASHQSQNNNLQPLMTHASPNVSSNSSSMAGFNVVEDGGEVGDEIFRDPNNCCTRCFKKAKFVCSVCQATKYCSKNCQDEHWSEHRQNCGAV